MKGGQFFRRRSCSVLGFVQDARWRVLQRIRRYDQCYMISGEITVQRVRGFVRVTYVKKVELRLGSQLFVLCFYSVYFGFSCVGSVFGFCGFFRVIFWESFLYRQSSYGGVVVFLFWFSGFRDKAWSFFYAGDVFISFGIGVSGWRFGVKVRFFFCLVM